MAMDMFLKLGDINGESVDKDPKHKDSIDVLAWSWGLSNAGTTHTGGGGGAGKVNVQDLSFTKYVDKASTALLLAGCNGKHYASALLTVRKAGEKPLEYIKITLKEVLVTSVSTGGSGGEDRLTENVTLNFATFKVEYTPQDKTGAPGKTVEVTWDIAGNTKEVG
jgi:type VI secretion system secreted protein Hcp